MYRYKYDNNNMTEQASNIVDEHCSSLGRDNYCDRFIWPCMTKCHYSTDMLWFTEGIDLDVVCPGGRFIF